MPVNYEELPYGFVYGAAEVGRLFSSERTGWVVLGLKTPKADLQIYVTKTGKVRISDAKGEWKPAPASDANELARLQKLNDEIASDLCEEQIKNAYLTLEVAKLKKQRDASPPIPPSDTSAERVAESEKMEHDPVAAQLWAIIAAERKRIRELEAAALATDKQIAELQELLRYLWNCQIPYYALSQMPDDKRELFESVILGATR